MNNKMILRKMQAIRDSIEIKETKASQITIDNFLFRYIIERYISEKYDMTVADKKLLSYLSLPIPAIDVIHDKYQNALEIPKYDKELILEQLKNKYTRAILEVIFGDMKIGVLENLIKKEPL